MKLGIKAYARHRKDRGLPGGSPAAVRKALERGQIRKTLDDQIDVAEADRDWPGDELEPGGNRGGEPAAPLVPPSSAGVVELLEERSHHRRYIETEYDGDASDGDRKELGELAQAKIRKELALARKHELDVEQLEGSLIPLDVHEERVESLTAQLASRVKNLGRYQGDVQRAITDVDAEELLERISAELLASLLEVADEIEDLEEPDPIAE